MKKREFYTLDILRGLSALLVVFYHYFIFFFTQQNLSANLLCIEPVDLADPFYLSAINGLPINIGHFGVSFFFLISGFFIQSSLEKRSSLISFLSHKLLRLWPSYACCFFIGLLFVLGFYLLLGYPFPYSFPHLFSYFFWIRDLLHYPYIDGAVWTLEIQIKFYIMAAVIWYCWKNHFLEKLCFLSLFFGLMTYIAYTLWEGESGEWFYIIKFIRTDLKYFLLILLGTCLYSFYKKEISVYKLSFLCVLLIAGFISPLFKASSSATTNGYVLGVAVFYFLILTSAQGKQEKNQSLLQKILNKISKISYPLYIGHVLPGYTLMYLMTYYDLNINLGILIAFPLVFYIAYFIHENIERPCISFSNKKKEKELTVKAA